jgi:hypothetical protein
MEQLNEFLESDRQWPRHLRIEHARYELRRASAAATQAQCVEQQTFWHAVLKANGFYD